MEMRFIKTVQFTSLIKAGGRLREFNFRKLRNTESEYFDVNVVDDRGERILFSMQKESNNWRFAPSQRFASASLPAWVSQQEDRLSEVIEEELRNG